MTRWLGGELSTYAVGYISRYYLTGRKHSRIEAEPLSFYFNQQTDEEIEEEVRVNPAMRDSYIGAAAESATVLGATCSACGARFCTRLYVSGDRIICERCSTYETRREHGHKHYRSLRRNNVFTDLAATIKAQESYLDRQQEKANQYSKKRNELFIYLLWVGLRRGRIATRVGYNLNKSLSWTEAS